MLLRRALILVSVSLSALTGACAHGRRPASYLPVGAPAQYGDRTQDGVVLLLRTPEAQVRAAVERSLASAGYGPALPSASDRVLETGERTVAGDTTLSVRAEILPPDPDLDGTVLVLTGRYSVPSARIRRAQVIQRPGERSPLYARLEVVADSVRRLAGAAP